MAKYDSIVNLTIAEFSELLDQRIKAALSNSPVEKASSGRKVYGIRGIEQLFNVSHKTAQYYKDHVIQGAVKQNGRKIVVDVDLALQLFDENNGRR